MNARVVPGVYASQTNVLRARLEEAGVAHGDVVRVDIPNARVYEGTVFFCYVPSVTVSACLQKGDGNPLPDHTLFVMPGGIEVNQDGIFNLKNLWFTSNGRATLIFDAESRVEMVRALG